MVYYIFLILGDINLVCYRYLKIMADPSQTIASPSTSKLEEDLARRPELTQLQAVITTCTTEFLSESRSNNEDTSRVQCKCHGVQWLIAYFSGHPLDSCDPSQIEIIDYLYQVSTSMLILCMVAVNTTLRNLQHLTR